MTKYAQDNGKRPPADPDFEVRYSPKMLREQRGERFKFGIFGILTSLAGFAYGTWAMLKHEQVDMGADLNRHLYFPGWVLMLVSLLWGAASVWAMRKKTHRE